MTEPSPNFWQKAKAKIQDITTSPQAEQVKKMTQNAMQQVGATAQELQHQTEEFLQSERVQHLRQDATQTAHEFTHKASAVLGQVAETIKTTANDLVDQAQKQLQSPPQTDPKDADQPKP